MSGSNEEEIELKRRQNMRSKYSIRLWIEAEEQYYSRFDVQRIIQKKLEQALEKEDMQLLDIETIPENIALQLKL